MSKVEESGEIFEFSRVKEGEERGGGGGRKSGRARRGKRAAHLPRYPVIVPGVQLLHCKWRDETSTVAFRRNCRQGNARARFHSASFGRNNVLRR